MARKKRHEEHENHERWLVSYADFITLLFAFFVVMYAISSVNEGKYRVLSDALVAAFRDPARSLDPIQVGQLSRSPYQPMMTPRNAPSAIEMQMLAPPMGGTAQVEDEAIGSIADEIEQSMAPLIEDDLIELRREAHGLEVEIKTSILFSSGSSRMGGQSTSVLRRLASILEPHPNRINVEGFTDNRPINTLAFPSNWELSAARAATVVRLFSEYGLSPDRMAAIGYGEFRPVADNRTAQGRSKNRRVVLVILANPNAGQPTPDGSFDGAQQAGSATSRAPSTAGALALNAGAGGVGTGGELP